MIKSPRIVFMGTPEFAVSSLKALVENHYNIVGVVTAPDKPAGRGMKLQESAVKQYAVAQGLRVLQPVKLKDPEFISALKELQADLQIVVAFRMLPEIVWNMPPMGTLNVHGSLLPQYRGAAPINWAIINGEKTTGVTTFKLKHEIDTGAILLQEKMEIGVNESAGEVHDRMKELGAQLLVKTVDALIHHTVEEKPQIITENQQHAPKIFTETCKIDFSKTAKEVHDLIRGLSPFPGAFTFLDGKSLKLFKTVLTETPTSKNPGEIETNKKNSFKIACADQWLEVLELQLEGKKKMNIEDFLRGYRFNDDIQLKVR